MDNNKFIFKDVEKVIAPGATINGGIVADTVNNYGSIAIGSNQLEGLQSEYSKALKDFTEEMTKLLEKNKVPKKDVQPVQNTINELSNEMKNVKDDNISVVKKKGIASKIYSIVGGLVKLLPKTVETVAAFTPLAPFGKIMGESVDEVVKAVQNEE